MIVYILEAGFESYEPYIVGVFSSYDKACDSITGEDEDYERMSDTEEMFATSTGEWVITEVTVDKEIK